MKSILTFAHPTLMVSDPINGRYLRRKREISGKINRDCVILHTSGYILHAFKSKRVARVDNVLLHSKIAHLSLFYSHDRRIL